nr:hypothetical protein [Deltaproteobacteria bacterium]
MLLWVVVFGIYARLAKQAAVVILMDSYQYERATVASVVAFRAATPFQYRVLVPAVIHWVAAHGHGDLRRLADAAVWISLLAVLGCFLALLRCFLPFGLSVVFAPTILPVLWWDHTPIGTDHFLYLSDFPAVAFLALGITLLLKRRYGWFYLVFVVATVNRETSILLTVAFLAMAYGREPLRRLAGHAAAQAALWVVTTSALRHAFADNPGAGTYELHLWGNLELTRQILLGANTMLGAAMPLLFGGAYAIVPFFWSRRSTEAKRLLWLVPVEFAIMFFVGNILELRIYDDALLIVLLNACLVAACFVAAVDGDGAVRADGRRAGR